MLEHLLLPCMVTVAAIALSAILFKGFLKKRPGQPALEEGSADNDSATENGTVERAARTCTTPQVEETEETATSSGHDYEVFLSFRGPDTRSGFTDYLYTSLTDAGIRTFRDDDALRVGEEFAPELLEAINQSKILIPIFSKGYASSVWCLRELVQMVKCQKNEGQKIMPIFYDVTPSDVRRQTGSFKKAFVSHQRKRRYDEKTIAEWKDALTTVADINGWDLQSMPNRQEGQLAKRITQKVFNELKKAYLVVSNCLVNVDNHVDAIMELIAPHTSETRMIGIYGMGGIGKTTTGKIIYNQLLEKFECCCFLSNIREMSERKGIEFLQNQLISDILKNKCTDITNVDDGINTIKHRLSNKRVLLLLDDVQEKNHTDALAGECDWFGKGSKLIITTRNKEVLDVLGVKSCYELWGMDHNQSLQLFSKHAFRRDYPLDEYINQSKRAIEIAGGLPLALELMGSLLSHTEKEKWDSKLGKWESDPHKDVQSRLKISYDVLEDKEKKIFLDIACLLIGYDKDIVVHFWESEFHPEYVMDVLENMSLIKIKEDNMVWMHDQLRDLGRQIACQETNINKQIRAWDPQKPLDVLKSHEMKKKVEALRLHLDHRHCFTYEDFKSLPNLRFLEVDEPKEIFNAEKMLMQHRGPSNVLSNNVFRKNSNLLPQLRWLSWQNIHPTFEIENFSMENVTVLNLSDSEITHDWKGWSHMKVIKNLKVLNLAHCQRLKTTPNFSAHSNLKYLFLSCCESLIEIDGSICQLKSLVFLDLSYCLNLQRLPETVGNLDSLTTLDISHMTIEEVPNSIGMLKNLKVLNLAHCQRLKRTPDFSAHSNLKHLILSSCESLIEIDRSICQLKSLVFLDVSYCWNLQRLPETVVNLDSLTELDISHTTIEEVPNSIGMLKNLKVMKMHNDIPERIRNACLKSGKGDPGQIGWNEIYVKDFDARVGDRIYGYESLRKWGMGWPGVHAIPRLPESLIELELEKLRVDTFPDISNLANLKVLHLGLGPPNCDGKSDGLLEEPIPPPWIGNLSQLESLHLRFLKETKKKETASSTDLSLPPHRRRLPTLPSSLSVLRLSGCDSLGSMDLSNLRKLSSLHILDCHSLGSMDLSNVRKLSSLQISGCNSLCSMDLSNLRKLSSLKIWCCYSLCSMDLSNLMKLSSLVIYSSAVAEIEGLGCLENLQDLDLQSSGQLAMLPDLSNLNKLRDITVWTCGNLVEIQGELPPSLETLKIIKCGSLQKLPDLSSLKGLREVTIRHCGKLAVEEISRLCSEKSIKFVG